MVLPKPIVTFANLFHNLELIYVEDFLKCFRDYDISYLLPMHSKGVFVLKCFAAHFAMPLLVMITEVSSHVPLAHEHFTAFCTRDISHIYHVKKEIS